MKVRMRGLFATKNVFKMEIAHKKTWDSVSITGRIIVFISILHDYTCLCELPKTLVVFNHTGVDQAVVIYRH